MMITGGKHKRDVPQIPIPGLASFGKLHRCQWYDVTMMLLSDYQEQFLGNTNKKGYPWSFVGQEYSSTPIHQQHHHGRMLT